MSPEKLARMVNQIGRFFAHQPEETAVASIAGHIGKYWEPRMRKAILEYLASGGRGLDPVPMKAVTALLAAESSRTNAMKV